MTRAVVRLQIAGTRRGHYAALVYLDLPVQYAGEEPSPVMSVVLCFARAMKRAFSIHCARPTLPCGLAAPYSAVRFFALINYYLLWLQMACRASRFGFVLSKDGLGSLPFAYLTKRNESRTQRSHLKLLLRSKISNIHDSDAVACRMTNVVLLFNISRDIQAQNILEIFFTGEFSRPTGKNFFAENLSSCIF